MSDELQELVNRFLAWKLPTDFYPDCHIYFDREKAEKWGPQLWPSGTNLLNADQARAMLEHVTEPLRTQFADTERDNANLRTVMIAAAEEIATHWTAHCNAEGYGPINLLRRLQEGIAAQYGYTGGGWARINSELATLRTQLAAMTAERDALQTSMNELRKTCAEIIGADPQTWPDHGNAPLAIAACLALRDAELRKTTAERDAALAKVAVLWGVVDDLTDKTEEVIRISDRKHDSWDAAKASIKRAYTALEETK